MGVHTFVPVQEAFHIDNITDFEVLYCFINICTLAAEIGFYGESIGFAINGYVEIEVIAILTGSIPFEEIRNIVAFRILGSSNCHTLEGYKHILIFDEIFCAEKRGYVLCGSDIATFENFPCCIYDFNFACPFSLVTADFELCANGHLIVFFFCAGEFINEVCAVCILCVDGRFVLPPTLLCLNICFNYNSIVDRCCRIFRIGHGAFGFFVDIFNIFCFCCCGCFCCGCFCCGFCISRLITAETGKNEKRRQNHKK